MPRRKKDESEEVAEVQEVQDESVQAYPLSSEPESEPEEELSPCATGNCPVTPPKYATTYLKKNGLPYCETCGAQHVSNVYGEPLCPEKREDCPRLQ